MTISVAVNTDTAMVVLIFEIFIKVYILSIFLHSYIIYYFIQNGVTSKTQDKDFSHHLKILL